MKNGIGERARPGRRTHPLAPSRLRSGVGRAESMAARGSSPLVGFAATNHGVSATKLPALAFIRFRA
jgi:hypothetical protein